MLSYCLKCRKNTDKNIPKFVRTIKRRTMLSYKSLQCVIVTNQDLMKSKK